MEGALAAGEALGDDAGILVDEDRHVLSFSVSWASWRPVLPGQ
jgi:hypothetical protein